MWIRVQHVDTWICERFNVREYVDMWVCVRFNVREYVSMWMCGCVYSLIYVDVYALMYVGVWVCVCVLEDVNERE